MARPTGLRYTTIAGKIGGSMLLTFAVSGYRSLRETVLPLSKLNLVTGPNGSGKSSIYKAINLLASIAQGRMATVLAQEGGLQSSLWAGPEQFARTVKAGVQNVEGTRRLNPIRLKLGFSSMDFGYAIELGLPIPSQTKFGQDPEIKSEAVWAGALARPASTLVSRAGPGVFSIAAKGKSEAVLTNLAPFESMMTMAANPQSTPELIELRERMRAWRFYDHFRTDPQAPARRPQVGTRTPALANDGSDLPAALRTIIEIGDAEALDTTFADAFPGSKIEIEVRDGYFELRVHQHGLLRPLRSAELSDGTLRYLLLAAALLTPRPPSLMILNEPESSLHVDLLPALARLIIKASEYTQLIIVSHARPLVEALVQANANCLTLRKEFGETLVTSIETPRWVWPGRS